MVDPALARLQAEPAAAQQRLLTAVLERLHELEPDGARWSGTLVPARRNEEAFGPVLRLARRLPSGAEQVSTITTGDAARYPETVALYVDLVARWQAQVLGWLAERVAPPEPDPHRRHPDLEAYGPTSWAPRG